LIAMQEVVLDNDSPFKKIETPTIIEDLKDPAQGDRQKVDIALQGPQSRNILLRLADDHDTGENLRHLQRTQLMDGNLAGVPVIIAHTGYTGEPIGYEIFVHPDVAPDLWNAILDAGHDWGVIPAGLAARPTGCPMLSSAPST